MSDEPKTAQEVLEAINRVNQIQKEKQGMDSLRASVPSPRPPSAPSPVTAPAFPPSGVEFDDQSDENDGTIFLLWYDAEDAKRFPQGQQQGIFPMKSPMYLAKHIDFHDSVQKQNALQEIAGIVEMFENDSLEVRGRGKYAIIIGKMVQIEVQKRIVIK